MAELDVGKLSLTIEADGRAAITELNRVKEAAEGASTDAMRAYQDAGEEMADAFEPAAEAAEETAEAVEKVADEAKKTGNEVQSAGQKATKSLKVTMETAEKFGSTMTKSVTAPLIALYGAMVNSASDLTETIGKTEVTFAEFSSDVMDWSEGAVESMGLAQGTALDMASTFGDMAVGMDIATGSAASMSMNLTQLAADLASFKNISADRAATALTGVFTGETEALKSLGIVMTQTNLQAYALSQGITTQVSAMSQAEQVMLRYSYVMAQTANAQGDFVRTGGNLANQSRALVQTLKQAGTSFGEILTPAITGAVSTLREAAQGLAELDDQTKTAILSIGTVVAATGPLVLAGTKVVKLVTTLKAAMSAVSLGPVAIGITAIVAATAGLYTVLDKTNSAIDTTTQKYQNLKRTMSSGSIVEITAQTEELDALDGRKVNVSWSVNQSPDSDQDAWDTFSQKIEELGWETKEYTAIGKFDVDETALANADAYKQALLDAARATDEYDAAVNNLNNLLDQELAAQVTEINAQTAEQMDYQARLLNSGIIDRETYDANLKYILDSSSEAIEALEGQYEITKKLNEQYDNGVKSDDYSVTGDQWLALSGGATLTEEDYQSAVATLEAAKAAGEDMTKYQNEALIVMNQLATQSVADYDAMTAAQEQYTRSVEQANAKEEQTIATNQQLLDNAQLMQQALVDYGEGLELYNGDAEAAIGYAADNLASNAEEFEVIKQQLTEQLTSDKTGELMTGNYGEVYDTFVTMAEDAQNAIEEATATAATERETAAQAFTDTMTGLVGDFTTAETQILVEMAASTGIAISEEQAALIASTEAMIDETVSQLENGGPEVADAAAGMIESVSDAVDAQPEGAEIGAAITAGVTAGLNNGTGALYRRARNIINTAIAEMQKAADAHSPSRKSKKLVGLPIIQGVGVGVEEGTPEVVKTMRKSVESVISGGTQVVNQGGYTIPKTESAGAFGIDYDLMGEKLTDAVSAMRMAFYVGDTELAKATRESNARQSAIRQHEINMGRGRAE